MSQHTGSHKNSLNLLGEKCLNESHWPMPSAGHISSNYHQHSKCTVLFVKHHYFQLSSFKKLLSSC